MLAVREPDKPRLILRVTAMMEDNLFQKIIDRKIPATIIYEDDRCLAFRDINPQAPVHVLIIPRKVIPTHADIKPEDRELLGHLHVVAAQLAEQLGITDGYRIIINCKERAGQTVPHLHLHLLGGRDFRWPPG
jgi:histidine triad (HIT) family protein